MKIGVSLILTVCQDVGVEFLLMVFEALGEVAGTPSPL